MNRITIKNVYFSEKFSEETNAFTADVYLDNKKFGYAKNEGHGGCTDIKPYPEMRGKLQEAEAYAISLGEIDFDGFKMKATLDAVVDDLLEKHLEAKELKKVMGKGIVYKDKKGLIQLIQWKIPFKKVLAHPKANEIIRTKVLEIRSAGGEVLNTNIPEEMLK